MTEKEQELADTLKCPNCGNKQFIETSVNAALGFRCDCGLEFNFMPELRIVDITKDPEEIIESKNKPTIKSVLSDIKTLLIK